MSMEPIYTTIGANIRSLRRLHNLTQQQLAEHLGFQRFSSISDLERGRVRLHVHQLVVCAELFNVSVESLLAPSVTWEKPRKSEAMQDFVFREW